MIRQHRPGLMIATIVLAAGSLSLAGCTSAPQIRASASAIEDRATAACENIASTLSSFGAKIQDTLTSIGSGDASGAQKSFADARSDLSDAMAKIQNPQLKKALEDVDASTSKLGDFLGTLSTASPLADAATKAASDAQEAAKSIQDATAKLTALCPTK